VAAFEALGFAVLAGVAVSVAVVDAIACFLAIKY
jgi:hypothetical protein